MKITRKYIVYLTLFGALLCLANCAKDKGNYDLTAINEILIDKLIDKERIEVFVGESLNYKPVISQDHVKDADYEYRWYVIGVPTNKIFELSQDRDLDYRVTIPVGNYNLVYVVRDLKTGISTSLVTPLAIKSLFGSGVVILEEGSEGYDISQILFDGKIYRGLYSQANEGQFLPITTESLHGFYFRKGVSVQKPIYFFVTAKDRNSFEIDPENYKKGAEFSSFLTFNHPDRLAIQRIAADGSSHATYALIDGQVVFSFNTLNVPTFTGMLLGDYSLAPFIISGTNEEDEWIYNKTNFIGYDQKNGRFLWYSKFDAGFISTYSNEDQSDSKFDPNHVNKTCVYAGYSNRIAYSNWLMKDDAGKMYLYQMYPVATQKAGADYKEIPYSEEMSKATLFQGSTQLPHIYFAYENKIFLYDYVANSIRLLRTFPGNEKITALQFSVINRPDYLTAYQVVITLDEIYAATFDGTEGRVYEFEIPGTGILSSPKNTYGGFGNIKSIFYKTRQ